MKKMLNNKKGFSLIELLIAVAIMVVLAAIAVGIFSNVLSNSKDKADKDLAKTIQTAMLTYINETGDDQFQANATTEMAITSGTTTWTGLCGILGNQMNGNTSNPMTTGQKYGPYLNQNISPARAEGFNIIIEKTAGKVSVDVVPDGGTVAPVAVN